MRQTLFIILIIIGAISGVSAQADVPTTLRSLSLDEKSWIREAGFPLTKYDYDNSEINEELAEGLKLRKQGRNMTTLGWIGAGAGLIAIFIPKDGTSSGGQALAYGSAGLSLGGVVLTFIGSGKKRKGQRRIENAAYLYESEN